MPRFTGTRRFNRIGAFGGYTPSDGTSDTFERSSRDTDTNLVLGETEIGSRLGVRAASSVEEAQKLLTDARDINELCAALEATKQSPQVLKAASASKEKLRKEQAATAKALEIEVSKLDQSWNGTGVHSGVAGSV